MSRSSGIYLDGLVETAWKARWTSAKRTALGTPGVVIDAYMSHDSRINVRNRMFSFADKQIVARGSGRPPSSSSREQVWNQRKIER